MRRRQARKHGPQRRDPVAASVVRAALMEGSDLALHSTIKNWNKRKEESLRENCIGPVTTENAEYAADVEDSGSDVELDAVSRRKESSGEKRRKAHLAKMSKLNASSRHADSPSAAERIRMQDEIDYDNLPWFVQKKELPSTKLPNESQQEIEENLLFYKLLGARPHIAAIAALMSAAHSTYYFLVVLPDEIQVCQRDEVGEWLCEIGKFAETLIDAARKKHVSIHTQGKNALLIQVAIFVLVFNTLIVVGSQLIPCCLSKALLPPPPRTGMSLIDHRRVDLLSTFGIWLANIGILGNITFTAVMHYHYESIIITHEARTVNDGGQGRGIDLQEISHIALGGSAILLFLTARLVFDVIKAEERDLVRHKKE